MFLSFALLFAAAACVLNIYILASFIRCRGKYPPFISSFGQVKRDVLKIAGEILAKKAEGARAADLGCGSGVLLAELAKDFPKTEFWGFEWDPVAYACARRKTGNYRNIKLCYGDFMKADVSDFDLILCYVGTGLEQELGNKLNREIKPGAVVVSEVFELAELKPVCRYESSLCRVPAVVYVYQKNV